MNDVLLIALIHQLPRQSCEGLAWPYPDEVTRYPSEGFAIDLVEAVGSCKRQTLKHSNSANLARLNN